MITFEAVMIAEGNQEADQATQAEAWQTLIDNNLAFTLQGAFGRQAVRLIEAGICTPPAEWTHKGRTH